MLYVRLNHSIVVTQYSLGFVKRDAMISPILSGFSVVPFEP